MIKTNNIIASLTRNAFNGFIAFCLCFHIHAYAVPIETLGFGVEYKQGALGTDVFAQEFGGQTSFSVANQISQDLSRRDMFTRARADLSTGEIGTSSRSIPMLDFLRAQAASTARMVDTLSFDLSGMQAGSAIDINIGMALDGFMTPFLAGRESGAFFFFDLQSDDDQLRLTNNIKADEFIISGLNPTFAVGDTITFGDLGFRAQAGTIGDWMPFDLFRDSNYSGLFTLETGKVTEVSFEMSFLSYGNADFFNSAHLSFDSPVDFTSASGVFMNGNGSPSSPSPVSTPTTGALLSSALVLLTFGNRQNAERLRRITSSSKCRGIS